MKEFLKRYNISLVIVPFLLFLIGFLTLVSTSQTRGREHVLFFMLGVFLYVLISIQDYHIFHFMWKLGYWAILILLILTYIIGEIRLGASRWLSIGVFTFQPSELAKFVLIIVICSLIYTFGENFNNIKNLTKIGVITIPLLVLVFIQPDLGTTLVLISIIFGTLFIAGLRKIYFIIIFSIFGLLSTPIWNILQEYQKKRILVFLNPQLDVLGSGYNVIQSLIAIGSGGLFGLGFSRGTQTRLNFLPAHWTDFVFASFAEEWGFIGVLVLFLLYFILLTSILYISTKVTDVYGKLVSFSVFVVFLFQFLVNVGMNLGLMPVTGIPLPLISSGGSSMIVSMLLLGLVQSIWIKHTG